MSATAPGAAARTQGMACLLRLKVRHSYFKNGLARDLDFAAMPDTAAFLGAHGVQAFANGGTLALQVDPARRAALWDERLDAAGPRSLDFWLYSTDPLSQIYTEPGAGPAVFGPAVGTDQLLQAPPSEGGANPAPSGPKARLGLPLGLARLPLIRDAATLEAWEAQAGPDYGLSLAARATTWTYLLLGDWSGFTPRLTDLGGQIPFSDPEPLTLEDGSAALAIRSLQPIALMEAPTQRFQLKDAGRQPEQVLVKRLALASPAFYRRETRQGHSAIVSEIFIQR